MFGIGPAGTGKTYLAMAMALAALMKNQVTRMVLCRPAVEAGEKLGFLPGDLAEKVNPYLRPLYDALHDMVDFDRARRMLERGTIEVAPLAFMRGRTLNDSFIILDEAQNTTTEQMKMFLTRLGYNSKAVVTGDITQIDLPSGKLSGLKEARAPCSPTPRASTSRFSMIAMWCGIAWCSGSSSLTRLSIAATRLRRRDRTRTARGSVGVVFRCASPNGRRYSRALKRDALALMKSAGLPDCELSLTLTSNASIRELNRDYRHKDRATDVLSFSQIEERDGVPSDPRAVRNVDGMPLGDVVISIDTALAQARKYGIRAGRAIAHAADSRISPSPRL